MGHTADRVGGSSSFADTPTHILQLQHFYFSKYRMYLVFCGIFCLH